MNTVQQSVLVTGANGFIGRSVCAALRRTGMRVVAVDAHINNSPEEACTRCDITDTREVRRVFETERPQRVIHLAAVLPTAAGHDPVRATAVNVEAGLNLLLLACEFGVRRFVFASSLSVYGSWDASRSVSECDRASPEDLYGAGKLYVEQLGASYRRQGLEFVSLRIGRVIGPGSRSATSAWRSQMFELLHTANRADIELPYEPSERVLLVHVDDVSRMLLHLLQATAPKHAVYNALCEAVVIEELKRELESLNPNLSVQLGNAKATGNPRALDSSRFEDEFKFQVLPMFQQLREAAAREL